MRGKYSLNLPSPSDSVDANCCIDLLKTNFDLDHAHRSTNQRFFLISLRITAESATAPSIADSSPSHPITTLIALHIIPKKILCNSLRFISPCLTFVEAIMISRVFSESIIL
jgi:hypothetical protein